MYICLQMLKTVGAGGHYPTNKLQAEDGEEQATPSTMLTMLAANVMGRAQALAETVLLVIYKVCLLGTNSALSLLSCAPNWTPIWSSGKLTFELLSWQPALDERF